MVQCGSTIFKVKVVDIGNLIVTTRLRSYLKSVCGNLTIGVQFDYLNTGRIRAIISKFKVPGSVG